ncbi:DUF6264 family protein [Microbacterium sp. SS28]|uniref:DUF6264 family protein n=1 Tax=Microbacterium sp. SS28 TaxID=2919948 RepID=UPI001FAA681C|nr:DUF6264 family protein [Microbacterium sp. SS28]
MSDSPEQQPLPRPHDADSSRPRPQYGEYATPEEQASRIRQPDATWALQTGQAPETADAPTVPGAWPVDTSPPPPLPSTRGVDRGVTLALLAIGAFNSIFTAISYFDFAALANQAMQILGVPGEFTNLESARLWGPIAAVVLLAGFALTAFLAWRSMRARRLSWWIPVVGAIVTYIVVYICIAIPLLGDAAFMEYTRTFS